MITYKGKKEVKSFSMHQDYSSTIKIDLIIKKLKEEGIDNIDILDIIVTSFISKKSVTEGNMTSMKNVQTYMINVMYVENKVY